MVEPTLVISIITLVSSIISPLVLSFAYALRKIKKSSCMNCFSFESNEEKSPKNPPIDLSEPKN